MRFLAAAPARSASCCSTFKRKGAGVFDAYDQYDLRALAGKHGVPASVLHSGFFRQFYEAAFNAPAELSAAVALQSIYKIFSKKWHATTSNSRRRGKSIIAPLQRHFIDRCHGRIEFNHKLIRVRADEAGSRAAGLDFENLATGGRLSVAADEYVLALGLEDFKRVDFGAIASERA